MVESNKNYESFLIKTKIARFFKMLPPVTRTVRSDETAASANTRLKQNAKKTR